MSANTYTTSDLVSLVKVLGHVPASNSTFTAATLLTLADLELRTAIAKQLKEANEGYFEAIYEYAQNASGEYAMPSQAIASTLQAVQIRSGDAIWPVSKQEVSEMTTTSSPSAGNWSFFIRGNTINVLPAEFSGVLRLTYDRRPSKLVPVTSCAQVSAINGQVVTVTSVPSAWVVGDSVDLQMAQPQFDVTATCTISLISLTDITLVGDLTALSVGDYLCLEGQTCVPQIPVEFHPLLAQRVVCKIYELQGYMDKLGAAKKMLQEMEDNLTSIITPRTQSSPKIVHAAWGGRAPGRFGARFNPPAGASGS